MFPGSSLFFNMPHREGPVLLQDSSRDHFTKFMVKREMVRNKDEKRARGRTSKQE